MDIEKKIDTFNLLQTTTVTILSEIPYLNLLIGRGAIFFLLLSVILPLNLLTGSDLNTENSKW